MNPALKYTLGRIGFFLLFGIPAVLLFPGTNVFLVLMIAFVLSAATSFFLLRQWRDEVGEQIVTSRRRRTDEKERLRAALSTEDDEPRSARS